MTKSLSHAFVRLEKTYFEQENFSAEKLLEELHGFISTLESLDLYSSNETLEDLSTSALK